MLKNELRTIEILCVALSLMSNFIGKYQTVLNVRFMIETYIVDNMVSKSIENNSLKNFGGGKIVPCFFENTFL